MPVTSKKPAFTPARAVIPNKSNRIGLFLCALAFMTFCFGVNAYAASVHVDVLYMNHAPMQPTIREIRAVFSRYGEKIAVSWYDADTKEARQFAATKGLHEHVPLSIWIDGAQSVKLGRRVVTFAGFPSGSGPEPFQGNWTMQDIKAALDQAISGRR